MIDILVNMLSPIFVPMGVSIADLTSYLTMCKNYVYAILALIIALVVIQVGTHFWVKKGTRHIVRWSSALAFVLAVVLVANLVCFGPLYNNISGALNATSVNLNEDTEQQSKDTIKQVGEEGLVLVKNDGLLPLSEEVTSLNVFGWDSTNPLFGGVGSGSSDGSSAVGIIQSLQDAGYQTNEELTKMYTDYRSDRPGISMSAQDWTLPEPTIDYYTDEIMSGAENFSNTAVITIGRSGGEGADLPKDMNAVINGTYDIAKEVAVNAKGKENLNYQYLKGTYTNNGDYDDFDEGEHYLQLSNTEEAMIDLVCSTFENVIVVINSNNTMELDWVDDYDSIGHPYYALYYSTVSAYNHSLHLHLQIHVYPFLYSNFHERNVNLQYNISFYIIPSILFKLSIFTTAQNTLFKSFPFKVDAGITESLPNS